MQNLEFEKLVKAKTIAELQHYVPLVLDLIGDTMQPNPNLIQNFVEITGRLASMMEKVGMAKEQPEGDEMQGKASVTTEFLSDRITPWIEDIRQEIFNTRVPPYRTPDEGLKWIKEESAYAIKWVNKIRYAGEKLPNWIQRYIDFSLETLNPKLASMLGVTYPSYLCCLVRAMEVARVTGFSCASVVCHIISGLPLTLNNVDTEPKEEIYELPSGDELVNRFVTVQIRGELTSDELRRLYQQIRQDLGIERTKPLKEKHSKLYRLVQDKGGSVKGTGSKKFWTQIVEEWNNPECKTWKGAKIAYVRLMEKLESQWSPTKSDKPVKEKS